jgi:L-fuconolactonase
MIGSDWPVCTVAANYEEVMQIVEDYISDMSENEQARILGLNAVDFYQLK